MAMARWGAVLAAAYHGLYDVLEYRGGPWHFATLPVVALMWYFLTASLARFRGTERL
jgi:hypothetical protein